MLARADLLTNGIHLALGLIYFMLQDTIIFAFYFFHTESLPFIGTRIFKFSKRLSFKKNHLTMKENSFFERE